MSKAVDEAAIQRTWDEYVRTGNNAAQTGVNLSIPRATVQSRVHAAKRLGLVASSHVVSQNDPLYLKSEIRRLSDALKKAEQERLDHTIIREKILQLNRNVSDIEVPRWMSKTDVSHSKPGVPTLFISDLHWAEVVDGKQINGVNRYNLEIAHARMEHLVERAVRLCEIISPNFEYPGIVVPLGGDFLSGNIHDELTATNEVNSMPALLDLFETLCSSIKFLSTKFQKLFLPCVTGNHGRDTRKIWSKDRHHTSFDWLLYCFLAKRFVDDKNVTFLIPDGSDAYYKIYNHFYLLTHGDQFRGGDGVIGALGPIVRGDHRKRSRNMQINMSYDTMICGHWHQYMQLQRLIVNGCFPAGTPVTLSNGTVTAINMVKVGDTVVTRHGNHKTVVDVYSRDDAEELIGLRCGSQKSELKCTPNHRIWAIKGSSVGHLLVTGGKSSHTHHNPKPGWVEAGLLSVGDYIEVPVSNVVVDQSEFTMDFCRLLGFFLAEGSISGVNGKLHHIDFTFHEKETEYADFVERECLNQFGKAAQYGPRTRRSSVRSVVVNSIDAAQRMFNLCGKGAATIKLRPDLMLLPPKKQKEILIGWLLGDGHTTTHRRYTQQGIIVSGTTISRDLIEQLRSIALRCKIFCSVASLKPGTNGRRNHETFSLLFTGHTARTLAMDLHEYIPEIHEPKRPDVASFKYIDVGGSFFARISDVWLEKFYGTVYNLTVEDDHSYIANGVGVANSLKGYDEYAYSNNFPFEPPQQAMWLTHPKYGITYRMPVQVEVVKETKIKPWVSITA